MAYYTRPEQLFKAFIELFDANKGLLGLKTVGVQDENLLIEYPAIEISMGPLLREDHGTQRFQNTYEMSFWIYHANYEETHRQRTITDMELATEVVRFLHTRKNRALNDGTEDRLIGGSGVVVLEVPGETIRRTGARVITTRLVWNGRSLVNYEDA